MANVAHADETAPYPTRAEFEQLQAQLQASVDAFMHMLHCDAARDEALGVTARRSCPVHSARSGLYLAASEGQRLILEAARS